jgi:hypothetical protein
MRGEGRSPIQPPAVKRHWVTDFSLAYVVIGVGVLINRQVEGVIVKFRVKNLRTSGLLCVVSTRFRDDKVEIWSGKEEIRKVGMRAEQ